MIGLRPSGAVALAVVTLMPGTARAQASLQIPLEFEFLNPGARSLALGSAFVGLADDASAALTNPAGLTVLTRPEVSFEARARQQESRFLERGRLSGTPSNRGIDTIAGPSYGTSTSTDVGPGFLSFVYPGRRAAIAVYRHELTEVDERFAAQGVFLDDSRELSLSASRDLSIVTYGASAAWRVTPSLSLGGGISVGHMSFDAEFVRFSTAPADFFNAATFDPARAVVRTTQTGDDTGIGASAGMLWTHAQRFQVGLVFRKGADFTFEQTIQDDLPSTTGQTVAGTFQVPDVFAIGASMRFTDRSMIALEYTRVQYSDLERDYVDVQARPSGRQDSFVIDDGNEVHAGFEYVLADITWTPALRVGYWFDPAHAVTYQALGVPDATDQRFEAYLPKATSLSHVTFGGGIAVSRHLEINGAADWSSRRAFYSLLAIGRF